MTDKYYLNMRFESVDDDKETFMKIIQDVAEFISGRLINFSRSNIQQYHSLSQKTKAEDFNVIGVDDDVVLGGTDDEWIQLQEHCLGCQNWDGKECIADPLPEDVNTCFKAKEALYK